MSNELDASEPTRVDTAGREINHQYSKSLDWEARFLRLARATIDPTIETCSLLRPFSEIAIAKALVGMGVGPGGIMSCNANFRRSADGPPAWCRDCPKCRFVYLLFAPFIPRHELHAAFGGPMLEEATHAEGYRQLAGLDAKPYECVGTTAGVRTLICHLAEEAGWKIPPLAALRDEIRASGLPIPKLASFLVPSDRHHIPPAFAEATRHVEQLAARR